MRALIGLAAVLHVRVCAAEAECSDGAACGQRASLMQMKSVNTKQSNDGSMHSTLMYFQTFTEKLVHQFKARRAGQDPYGNNNVVDSETAGLYKSQAGAFQDATVAVNVTSGTHNQFDLTTMETVRDVMDTIRETLLGALLQNLDNALFRVGQCQLIEAYDGTQLAGNANYHTGYWENKVSGTARRMRKRIAGSVSLVSTDGSGATMNIRNADGLSGSNMNFNQRKIFATNGFKTIHQFCWDETFMDGDNSEENDLNRLDSLWNTAESKRALHKTCREDRVATCINGDSDKCEEYDNFRWYDPRARLETNGNICVSGGVAKERSTVFSDSGLAVTTDTGVSDMEACLRKTRDWLSVLYTKYKACNRAGEDACAEARAKCDATQHDFEVARCWWAVDHDYHCTSYKHCVQNRLTACQGVCTELDNFLDGAKRDYETGEIIQCLLESLFGRYNTAYNGNIDAGDNSTWPLIPRANETDADVDSWLGWCKNDRSGEGQADQATSQDNWKTKTMVLERFYHSDLNEYPASITTANSNYPTFDEILTYEKEWFDIRCEKGNKMRGARIPTKANQFTLKTPLADFDAERRWTTCLPNEPAYTADGTASGNCADLPGQAHYRYPYVGEYEDCSGSATCYEDVGCDPAIAGDVACAAPFYLLETLFDSSLYTNLNENSGATKYNNWATLATGDLTTTHYKVDGTQFTRKRPHLTNSRMGSVLHLTYLSTTYSGENLKYFSQGGTGSFTYSETATPLPWRNRVFDCSPEPVPGEWGHCLVNPPDSSNHEQAKNDDSVQKLTPRPHYGCFADIYRVDSLRTDVPACDIDVGSTEVFFLSHASFYKYGNVDATSNPEGLGCSGGVVVATARGTWIGQGDASTDGTAAASTHKLALSADGVGCTEFRNSNVQTYSAGSDATLYGTCCFSTDSASDPDAEYYFWEPLPSSAASDALAQTRYSCQNQYMFTLAERELAFGLKGATDGFHTGDATHNTASGYWKADQHTDIATTHATSVTALSHEAGGAIGCGAEGASQACSDVSHKTPWSLSSDIQGAYKVVSTTASLGTSCEFRHSTTQAKYSSTSNYDTTFEAGHDMKQTGTDTSQYRYSAA